jgi:translocation and assembly module TamB
MDHNRFTFKNIYSDFAGGTLRGQGQLEALRWNRLPLSLAITGSNLNLLVPQGVQTQGNATVTLTGEFFPYKLEGVYQVQRGLIDQEVGQTKAQTRTISPFLPPQLIEQRLKPIEFELRVILPTQLEVKNSMVRGTVTGELFIRGTPDKPKLAGQITVNPGTRLVFSDRELEVSTGRLIFTNPNEIDPELYLIAKGRIESYEVDLLVQGTASNPLIQAQSSPPLSQREVVSLIALGIVPGSEQAATSQSQQEGLGFGTQVGTVLLQNLPFFQKAQEATGFSVRLSSSFDEARETEISRVTVRRNITDRLRATATGESFGGREFRIEYKLNRNLSAAGTYKQQETSPIKTSTTGRELRNESFFGFDLEYLKEFR